MQIINSDSIQTAIYNGAKGLNQNPCSVCVTKYANNVTTTNIHFHGSQWGSGCLRKVHYELLNGSKSIDSGKKAMFLFTGHLYEATIIKALELSGFTLSARNKDLQSEVSITNDVPLDAHISYPVTTYCHPDGILEGKVLLEMKAVSSKSFQELKDKGKYNSSYFGQIQCYLHALKLNEAYLIMVHRDTSEVYTPIKIMRDQKFIDKKLLSLAGVLHNINNKQLSPRGHTTKSDDECFFCPYKEKCWSVK